MHDVSRSLKRLWNFSDPAGSEEAFRSLLAKPGSTLEPAAVAEYETQIARALGLQGDFDQGHAVLDGLLARRAESLAPVVAVRLGLERGRLLNSAGKPAEARPCFLQAYDMAKAERLEALAVDAAHMVALVSQGDEAQEWNDRAMEIACASRDEIARGWRGSLLNNRGWFLHDAGRFAEALAAFQEALVAFQEKRDEDRVRVARWTVARCLRSLGRTEEALERQLALHNDLEDAGKRDGFVFEEVGECLTVLGREGEAMRWFELAWRELSKLGWLDPLRLERLARLGGCDGVPDFGEDEPESGDPDPED